MNQITTETIWQSLESVKDPEIPVVSVVEMGIVRDVALDGDAATVTMTPTFSGCPALDVMRTDIETAVLALGIPSVTVNVTLAPPWTTDWITEDAKAKLKAFGLAPPRQHDGDLNIIFYDIVPCPRCNGKNTSLKNSFGPTLCRAIYYCHDCQDPFEQFKPL
ncbi:MAG: 1,2-phenylacetyl-CoA epoxidase subunit PaaD [Chloroflexota bacterium]